MIPISPADEPFESASFCRCSTFTLIAYRELPAWSAFDISRARFLDARHPDCSVKNEQLWIDLEEPDSLRFLRVKQISGAIARRIVCWLKLNERVQAGDRFGMIKFGSRTDVLMAASESIEVLAQVGDRVRGGSTVLLRFNGTPHEAPLDGSTQRSPLAIK